MVARNFSVSSARALPKTPKKSNAKANNLSFMAASQYGAPSKRAPQHWARSEEIVETPASETTYSTSTADDGELRDLTYSRISRAVR
jgi:hypothetical protein